MKRYVPVVLFLIVVWGVVTFILLTPEVSNSHGMEHSKFSSMDQGGSGLDRHESILVPGWIFGSLLIAFFVGLLLWATDKGQRWPWFLAGGLIFEFTFGMLCFTYWKSLTDPTVAFIGPFPASVSWMLFGVWFVPVFFIGLYTIFFRRWIFPAESARKFELLIKHRSETE